MAQIRWPVRYEPANTKVFVSNELVIPAPPEVIWAWLIRAVRWPEWYPNASDVRLPEGAGPDLAQAMQFRWRTFGVRIVSNVNEFEPYTRVAWDGHATGLDVYHAWVIEPHGPRESLVLTQESQNGWLARISNAVMPNRMSHYHQIWLERLSGKARGGPPA
jgi:hypothetical protein